MHKLFELLICYNSISEKENVGEGNDIVWIIMQKGSKLNGGNWGLRQVELVWKSWNERPGVSSYKLYLSESL